MDFRLYDGALGRFLGTDLLADMFTDHSPYHFAYNNPIAFSDPSGLQPSPGIYQIDYDDLGDGRMFITFSYFNGDDTESIGHIASVVGGSEPFTMKEFGINPHQYGGGGGGSGSGSGSGGGGGGSGSGGSGAGSGNNSPGDAIELIGNAGTATSIIEQGAERGQKLYSQEAVKNPNAAKNALKSANLAKWMSRVGTAANVVTLGNEAYNTFTNPNSTGADYAKIGAKIGVVVLEGVLNGAAPGLGIVVGIGLNYVIDKYGDDIYNSISDGYNRLAI